MLNPIVVHTNSGKPKSVVIKLYVQAKGQIPRVEPLHLLTVTTSRCSSNQFHSLTNFPPGKMFCQNPAFAIVG